MALALRLACLALPLAFLAGCSSGGFDGSVEVGDNYFKPTKATVQAGDSVHFEVESSARNPHTITVHKAGDPASTLLLDSDVQAGGEEHFTFPAAGTYHVWCTNHGTMTSGMAMVVTVE